tara:strand:- start:707 stop:853 length:147 start_codon:yes stop_codon:yes gene_type:complete
MEKLTKEEIVGELLISGEISAEEAITLLELASEELQTINPHNYTTTIT